MTPKTYQQNESMLIDQVIEQEIDRWIESKQRKPEQMELIEEEDNENF